MTEVVKNKKSTIRTSTSGRLFIKNTIQTMMHLIWKFGKDFLNHCAGGNLRKMLILILLAGSFMAVCSLDFKVWAGVTHFYCHQICFDCLALFVLFSMLDSNCYLTQTLQCQTVFCSVWAVVTRRSPHSFSGAAFCFKSDSRLVRFYSTIHPVCFA